MKRMPGLVGGLGVVLFCSAAAWAQNAASAPAPSDQPAKDTVKSKDPYKDNPVLYNPPSQILPEEKKQRQWPFTERGLDFEPVLSLRKQLEDFGISMRFREAMFYQNLSSGGIKTNGANDFSQKYNVDMSFDFGKMKLWEGGKIFLTFEGFTGYGLTRDGNVGDIFNVDRISGSPEQECYLKQYFFEQTIKLDSLVKTLKLKLDIGKMDVRGFFETNVYTTDYRTQFLNKSFVNNPTFVFNDGVLGVILSLEHEWAYLRAGVFNPRPAERLTGFSTMAPPQAFPSRPQVIPFYQDAMALFVTEVGITPKFDGPNGKLPGNYRVGLWYNGNTFKQINYNTYSGALPNNYESGLNGVYLSFDQMVWKENADPKDKQGIGLFAKYGTVAEKSLNAVNNDFSFGMNWTGPIPTRDDDVWAVGYNAGDIEAPYGQHRGYEQVFETYYNIAIFPWMLVGPDLQYIVHPSGGAPHARDALLFGMRFYMTF